MALGGDPLGNGTIRRDTLTKVCEEFGLTIDLEELFQKADILADQLDYQMFCKLFQSDGKDDGSATSRSRLNTVLTVCSFA